MADNALATETLEVGRPLTAGEVTLLPIERIVVRAQRRDGRAWVYGSKAFYALVLRDAAGTRAVDAGAAAITLDRLVREVPGLGAALRAIDPGSGHRARE